MKHTLAVHRGEAFGAPRGWGVALAFVAAAVVAISAAHADLGGAVIVWRAAVALVSIWAFQMSMAEVWKVTGPCPLPAAPESARSLRKRPPASE